MKVKSIVFRESGEYNDLANRPYVADFDNISVNKFITLSEQGRQLQPKSLASMASGMLKPSTEMCGIAPIASGWGEKRFMFLMQVEVHNDARQKGDMVISGYTDYVGATSMLSSKVNIDPNMRMFFNSKFHLKQLLEYGSRGQQWGSSVKDATQIITRTEPSDLSRRNQHGTLSMRPEDIISRGTTNDDYRVIAQRSGFRDTRGEFGNETLRLSSRGNSQSSIYLSKTLSALRDASDDDYLVDNENARLSGARAQVKENSILSDRTFEDMQDESNIMRDGFITWKELCRMNPNIDEIADVWFNDKRAEVHRVGDTERWGGSDHETIAATIIANTLPTYMTDAMYAMIDVTMTNDQPGGQLETVIGALVPFVPDTDVEINYNYLMTKLEFQLFQELMFNPEMTVTVRIRYSMYGDTRIDIQYDNENEASFVFPSFCDSVASPVVTNDVKFIDDLSTALIGLSRSVRESASSGPVGSSTNSKDRFI
jgi:hypothetical protein